MNISPVLWNKHRTRGFPTERMNSYGNFFDSHIFLFLFFPIPSAEGAKEALILCGSSVIGSLFPFMVISKMLTNADIIRSDNKIITKIGTFFHVSPCGVLALLLGMVCGYPMGAKTAADLCANRKISKREASYLLAFCNNCGPAFAVATVGAVFFGSASTGIVLFVCHILSSLMAGSVLRLFYRNDTLVAVTTRKQRASLSLLLTDAVKDSCFSMLNVVGVIVFFAAFFSVLKATHAIAFLSSLFGNHAKTAEAMVFGLFEITSGLKALSILTLSPVLKICLAEFLLSLGGISIFCQALSFTAPLDIKTAPYLIGKTLSSFLAMGLTAVWMIKGPVFLFSAVIVFLLITSAVEKPGKIVQIYGKSDPEHIRNQKRRRRLV